jgi:hypothetical protein
MNFPKNSAAAYIRIKTSVAVYSLLNFPEDMANFISIKNGQLILPQNNKSTLTVLMPSFKVFISYI